MNFEMWDLKPVQHSNVPFSLTSQATPPLSYYRSEPVYTLPYHITVDKLLKMLGITSKIFVKGR